MFVFYEFNLHFRTKHGPFRKLSGNNTTIKHDTEQHTIWSQEEKDLLKNEMVYMFPH